MIALPQIETQSPEAIREYQATRLREILAYVEKHSPFYRQRFNQTGIRAAQIRSIDDLRRLPVTTKDELQQQNLDFLCIPKNEVAEYTSTSGTLGKPVTIALSRSDIERLAYNEFISFACADGTASDLYQLMLTLDRQFMAGMAYYEGIRKLGGGLIRVGPGLPAMQWETILRLQPTCLVVVPSFLLKMIEFAREHKIDLSKTSVKKAVCIGESIRADDMMALSVLGKKITEAWDIRLYGTYASTEMQTAFTECGEGKGGHHHPELIVAELLDDQNQPVKEGEAGEVTITTLGVEAMPLIRYKTGDVARFYHEPCRCGRTTFRIGPIIGRKQQMIKLKGTTLYPPALFAVLNEFPFIQNYVVEAFLNETGTDEIRLVLHLSENNNAEMLSTLRNAFQSRLRIIPEIRLADPRELESIQMSGGRKLKQFVDHR